MKKQTFSKKINLFFFVNILDLYNKESRSFKRLNLILLLNIFFNLYSFYNSSNFLSSKKFNTSWLQQPLIGFFQRSLTQQKELLEVYYL